MLVVGPLPPPYHGCSVVIRNLLESRLTREFDLIHLDTADRRGIDNIGRLDARNVWLAGVHGAAFLRLLATSRPDVVYVFVAQNSLGFLRDALFLSPAALRGVPYVLHFQSGRFGEFYRTAPAPVRTLIRTLVSRAARAIVLGHSLVPMLEGLINAERIAVVPNAITDVTGSIPPRRENGRVRALYLGNLMPDKGYIELISAARALLAEGLDMEFVFAGAVSDAAAHERAREAASGARDRIRFVGPVAGDAKTALLRTADLLVLPTHYESEGHPLVLLEAMAAALPVVSTRHVAIPETVLHEVTGLLVDVHDTAGLASAIRRLATDPKLRLRLGEGGRARYLEQYTVTRWAERMAAVFDGVTARSA